VGGGNDAEADKFTLVQGRNAGPEATLYKKLVDKIAGTSKPIGNVDRFAKFSRLALIGGQRVSLIRLYWRWLRYWL